MRGGRDGGLLAGGPAGERAGGQVGEWPVEAGREGGAAVFFTQRPSPGLPVFSASCPPSREGSQSWRAVGPGKPQRPQASGQRPVGRVLSVFGPDSAAHSPVDARRTCPVREESFPCPFQRPPPLATPAPGLKPGAEGTPLTAPHPRRPPEDPNACVAPRPPLAPRMAAPHAGHARGLVLPPSTSPSGTPSLT